MLSDFDRRLILATQDGLPLVARPFEALAERLGVTPERVKERLRAMQEEGLIRRIAAVPNHYALGYRANAMTVWDVADETVDALGERIGALPFVSHCYRRPRHPPHWPYNLFAMVHAKDRADVQPMIDAIAAILGPSCRAFDVLYSSRILKKTGLRLSG